MNTTYAIDDGEGNQLATGLQEGRARIVAQRMANELGVSVYLYEIGENEAESQQVEVCPAP